jgi:hypothetical protein
LQTKKEKGRRRRLGEGGSWRGPERIRRGEGRWRWARWLWWWRTRALVEKSEHAMCVLSLSREHDKGYKE